MWQRPFYHEGMSELQDRFDGRRVAEAIERHRKHYEFWDDERAMIETSPFFFIGTSWNDYIDCNIKSGDPGFVKIVGPNIIEYPEYDGNSMYRTLGNLSRNPNVGLLFVRFDGKSRRMRINGRASILDDPEAIGRHFGAKLVVRIECEIYPNCPRYVPDLAGAKSVALRSPRRRGATAAAGVEAARLHQGHPAERRSASRSRQGKGVGESGTQHRLLDELVRQRAQLIRHSQSECLGGLRVDHQLELDWSLDRKLAWLLAFEDAVGIGRRTPVLIDENRTVRDQAAKFSE